MAARAIWTLKGKRLGQVVMVARASGMRMLVCGAGCRCLRGGKGWLQAFTHWQGPQPAAEAGANCGYMSSYGT